MHTVFVGIAKMSHSELRYNAEAYLLLSYKLQFSLCHWEQNVLAQSHLAARVLERMGDLVVNALKRAEFKSQLCHRLPMGP